MVGAVCFQSIIVCRGFNRNAFTHRPITYRASVVLGSCFHASGGSVYNPPAKGVADFIRNSGATTVFAPVPMVGAVSYPSVGIIVSSCIAIGLANRFVTHYANMMA